VATGICRKLPDELKVEILQYALPCGETFTSLLFDQSHLDDKYLRLKQNRMKLPLNSQLQFKALRMFQVDVFPLLACPEVRHLVPEVFYGQNTMNLTTAPRHFSYPRSSVGTHVRSVALDMQVTAENLLCLEKLATGVCGLPNLHTVDLKAVTTIYLQTKLLRIKYVHRLFRHYTKRLPDPDDMDVLAMFSVESRGKEVKSRVERYELLTNKSEEEQKPVSGWPDQEAYHRRLRVT
jgi:hypothetical protein